MARFQTSAFPIWRKRGASIAASGANLPRSTCSLCVFGNLKRAWVLANVFGTQDEHAERITEILEMQDDKE